MGEQQILIPVRAEVFWRQMKKVIEEVLIERNVIASSSEKIASGPKLIKMKEVCEMFQISKPTVYKWIRKGQLRSVKIESRRFFLANDIEVLIVNNQAPNNSIPG